MDEKIGRKVGLKMSLWMGITLSLFLSLTGLLMSGHFTFPGLLINFFISLTISLVIGFLVPMRKLNDSVDKKLKLEPRSIKANLINSLISDLIYTPVITIVLTLFAYKQAVSHGASISYGGMLLSSLIVCMLVGYALIVVFMPLYLKLAIRTSIPKPENTN